MSVDPAHLALQFAVRREAGEAARRLADLSPPLGLPGGPCKVIERIDDKVRGPRDREKLTLKVEEGRDLDNKESASIYRKELEAALPGSSIKKILLTPHAQYRMDLRGVNVNDVRLALQEWHRDWAKGKSKNDAFYTRMENLIQYGQTIDFRSSGGVTVVFEVGKWQGKPRGAVEVVTVYVPGAPKPKPIPRSECAPWEGWSDLQDYPKSEFDRHFQRVADLNPSLGFPGGACQVIERIDSEVPNLRLRDKLVDLVEGGDDLSNAEASQVYSPEGERGSSGTRFKRLMITPHAQYRMDLRGVNVSDLRLFFKRFQKAWADARSRQEPIARTWESDMAWGTPIEWTDSQGLHVVFAVRDRMATIVTAYWKGQQDPGPVDESACALPSRVAALHLREAGLKDLWLQWIVQPADVIWKHHKKFVQGPVDDAMDIIIKELAPELVKAIGEQEVDEDIEEFLEGAQKGAWDSLRDYRADPSGPTEDWSEGYSWGFANPQKVKGDLPPALKRQLVEEAVREYRRNITEEVAERALLASWNALSPITTFKAIWAAVKKYGWKLGVVIGLVEILETFVIPGALIAMTGDPEWALAGSLPLSEILYSIVFRFLGRVPSEVNEVEEDGHLDWYEAKFGPVRLASGLGDCYEANGQFFMDKAVFPGKDPNMRLVHGEVTGQGPLEGVKYGHAWVEDGNTVIDVSNGRNVRMPKDAYYRLGRIEDNVHHYTAQEFRRKVTQYGHWGPWDLVTSTGL